MNKDLDIKLKEIKAELEEVRSLIRWFYWHPWVLLCNWRRFKGLKEERKSLSEELDSIELSQLKNNVVEVYEYDR